MFCSTFRPAPNAGTFAQLNVDGMVIGRRARAESHGEHTGQGRSHIQYACDPRGSALVPPPTPPRKNLIAPSTSVITQVNLVGFLSGTRPTPNQFMSIGGGGGSTYSTHVTQLGPDRRTPTPFLDGEVAATKSFPTVSVIFEVCWAPGDPKCCQNTQRGRRQGRGRERRDEGGG